MKKIMILAAAAALVLSAACTKSEITSSLNDGENAIGFTNYSYRSFTKADGTFVDNNTTAGLVNDKKFGVYAYSTDNGTAWSTTAIGDIFMDGVAVTYTTGGDSDATKNTYAPTRYWPSGDTPDWLTFWAYYPVEATSGKVTSGSNGITYTKPTGSNNLGTFDFTAASTAAAMVDFMVADVVNDKIYGTTSGAHVALNGVVPLHFHHMLTKVQFKFKTDLSDSELATTKVYLTDAKLIDIRTERTLGAAYNASTGAPTTTWADGTDGVAKADTPANYEIFVNGKDVTSAAANKVDLTRTLTSVTASEVFLMVPQVMVAQSGTNPQAIRISWDVVTDNVTISNTKTLYLDECTTTDGGDVQANIDWAKNNFITYNITVGPKPIRFTADVSTWADEQNGYFNVN